MGASQGDEQEGLKMILGVVMWGLVLGIAAVVWKGPAYGLVGVSVGIGIGGTLAFMRQLRRIRTAAEREENIPDLRGLDPEKAMVVLGAATGASGSEAWTGLIGGGKTLQRVQEIRTHAETDLDAAFAAAQDMVGEHPEHAAVLGLVADLHHKRGADDAAATHASRAISTALRRGMNPMAAQLLKASAPYRDALTLEPTEFAQLARAARSHDDEVGATWCQAKAPDEVAAESTEDAGDSEEDPSAGAVETSPGSTPPDHASA